MCRQPNSPKIYSKPLESSFRDRNFWLENLPENLEAEPLRGFARCDVAIIGGGFTGLSTAYHIGFRYKKGKAVEQNWDTEVVKILTMLNQSTIKHSS